MFIYDSSPHLRGKAKRNSQRTSASRFIPAPAGKSHLQKKNFSPEQIHPRTCGEKHRLPGEFLAADGFIPAPAGKRRRPLFVCVQCQIHPRTCGEKRRTQRHPNPHTDSSPHLRGKDLVFTRLSGHCGMPLCNLHNLFFASSSTSNDFSYIFNMPKKIKN